jgi:hypothetical protein
MLWAFFENRCPLQVAQANPTAAHKTPLLAHLQLGSIIILQGENALNKKSFI